MASWDCHHSTGFPGLLVAGRPLCSTWCVHGVGGTELGESRGSEVTLLLLLFPHPPPPFREVPAFLRLVCLLASSRPQLRESRTAPPRLRPECAWKAAADRPSVDCFSQRSATSKCHACCILSTPSHAGFRHAPRFTAALGSIPFPG